MTQKDTNVQDRRSLITGLGIAAAGIAATAATTASAQQSRGFMPAKHALDAWMDEASGKHRIFVDSATPHGGGEALLYANNLYEMQNTAYSGTNDDLSVVVCFRHFSTPFGYTDAIWEKYGEQFNGLMQFPNPATGKAPMVNLMNTTDVPDLPNLGVTIDQLIARGAQFAICNAATQFISGQVANATGSTADEVYDELVANAIPNSRFVPAGVVALTRAQEYGYSLLVAG